MGCGEDVALGCVACEEEERECQGGVEGGFGKEADDSVGCDAWE